jgi:FtsH-binding integral membrane protein
MNIATSFAQTNLDTDTKSFFSKVFIRMGVAMAISGGTARYVATIPQLIDTIFSNSFYLYGILAIELWLVWYLTANIRSLSLSTASIMFIAYSALNGAILSIIFLIFQLNSILSIFGATTVIFIIMGWYGYTTNSDLTKIGNLAFMGLIGIIIWWVINIFLKNSMLDLIITSIGVIVFIALIAYDIQKLKTFNTPGDEWTDNEQKEAIIWALELYLDFINLFLNLLRLFGKRK